MNRIATPLIVGCVGMLFAASTCFAQMYIVTDVGTLGGSESLANGINNSGQVVGWSFTTNDNFLHAFRTAPNSPINPARDDLGTGIFDSVAYGINDSGQVVGGHGVPGSPGVSPKPVHAFRTAPNKRINPARDDLGTLGGTSSVAFGINDSGQVVGVSSINGDVGLHAFRTAANSPINPNTDDLGTLGGAPSPYIGGVSYAQGINDSGQVVGWSIVNSGPPFPVASHAFRTAANSAINPATDDLGTFGRIDGGIADSQANGINDSGQVVGWSFIDFGPPYLHAFRTAPNTPINRATDDLGTLGGTYSEAHGINASGQVVGFSFTNQGVHAFLYTTGVMYDLNNLIPPGSGWELIAAYGINDAAQIVGEGLHNGQAHAFLLTVSDEAAVQQPTNTEGSSITSTMKAVPVCWRDARLHGSPACVRQSRLPN